MNDRKIKFYTIIIYSYDNNINVYIILRETIIKVNSYDNKVPLYYFINIKLIKKTINFKPLKQFFSLYCCYFLFFF